MGGKIEKSWSVTAGGDANRSPCDAHFNIICKSSAATATFMLVASPASNWDRYYRTRKLSWETRDENFYEGRPRRKCASKGYEPMNANERRAGGVALSGNSRALLQISVDITITLDPRETFLKRTQYNSPELMSL